MRRHVASVAAAVLTVLTASSCRKGSTLGGVPTTGCAPAFQERLDSRSTVHLFPAATEPHYLTDPPTSGPHRPGLPYTGVLTAPISRPSQVAMLESGYVIVQFQGLPPDQQSALGALVGSLVTVAPPWAPLPTAVVATAWTWKMECGAATPAALVTLRSFIGQHRGVGFVGNVGFAGNIPTTTPGG